MVRWRQDPEAMIEETYPPSEDFEYMEVGPSPPAESAPSMYDSFEEPTAELSVQICADTIRSNLTEQMKSLGGNGHLKILEDIEQNLLTADRVKDAFATFVKIEKNIAFLWSAYLKKWELLDPLLICGADMNFCDSNGYTGLHLAAFSGCLNSTSYLLEKGMDVNSHTKCYTPLHFAAFGNSPETAKMLINNGAKISNTAHTSNGNGSQ